MENQNNQNITPPQPIAPVPNPVATNTQETAVQSPQMATDFNNFKNTIDNLRQNWKEKFNNLSPRSRMLVIIASIVFAIIFILFLLLLLIGPKKKTVPVLTPSPTPVSVTPAPNIILNASRYATDSGVLKIESDLNGFQSQLNSSDVKQSDLNLPNVDFNINFNQ
ncbi:MAG TPA: hypothetical protein VG895_01285 [Patescibacteria group bacterium]|nr:hypothetical protein [Patescibacteria group bacterium]